MKKCSPYKILLLKFLLDQDWRIMDNLVTAGH